MATDVDFLNGCLALIGQPPVENRDDPEGHAAFVAYDEIVGRVLGAYPWKFLRAHRQLGRDATAASTRRLYSFQVPSDMAGDPRAIYTAADSIAPFADWERQGEKICADVDALWMRYTRLTAGPDEWPPAVASCIRAGLRGELALAIREDAKLRAEFMAQAFGTPQEAGRGGLFAAARTLDAQGEPSTTIAMGSNPLVDVRR